MFCLYLCLIKPQFKLSPLSDKVLSKLPTCVTRCWITISSLNSGGISTAITLSSFLTNSASSSEIVYQVCLGELGLKFGESTLRLGMYNLPPSFSFSISSQKD